MFILTESVSFGKRAEKNFDGKRPAQQRRSFSQYRILVFTEFSFCFSLVLGEEIHDTRGIGLCQCIPEAAAFQLLTFFFICIKTVLDEDGRHCSIFQYIEISRLTASVLKSCRARLCRRLYSLSRLFGVTANAFGTDWNSANGWEVYTYKTGGDAEKAAKAVEAATKASSAGLKNRGCKTANFYVLKNTTMPAILIEHGFYTNKEECEKLKSSSFRDTLAQADATGIMNFFAQYK